MKIRIQILVASLVILSSACKPTGAELPAKTHDGRGGSACPHWPKHPSVQLCSPSMIRLIARGEDYDAAHLRISGYLRQGDSIFYLCPTQNFCEEDDWSGAVQLPDSKIVSALAGQDGLPSKRVTVIGKFSASTRGRAGQVAGVFLTIDEAYRSNGY